MATLAQHMTTAPGVSSHDRVVLFDGVCKLCNAWSRFLIRFDRNRIFKLASVQSPQGQAILRWHGLPTDAFQTMLLVEGPRVFTRSTAFVRVVARLPFPWFLAAGSWLIPRPVRDWLYDRVARHRYALFGRYDSCMLPDPDHRGRFLDDNAR